jgi:predicted Zn-dependent protease
MGVRTYVGILLGLLFAVIASYLTSQNQDLLAEPFRLGSETTVPLYAMVLVVFLVGFLPTVTVLLAQQLKRDLAQRRQRRAHREAESLSATYRRAVDYQADGQWARAAQELEVVLAERPEDFEVLWRYGAVLRELGRVEEALETHRRATVLFPRSVSLLYELAADYRSLGDEEVAREIRNRVLREFDGTGLRILRRRRNTAMAQRDWEGAEHFQRDIETLLAASGDQVTLEREKGIGRGLAYQRGVRLLEEEHVKEATEVFQDVLSKEPRFIPAAMMLGEAALFHDDEEGAVREWLRGYERTGRPVFLQRIEDHFIEGGVPARAIETLRNLIAESKNDLLPRFFLGRLYYRLEMHDEALKVLEGVGDRIHSSPTYHFLLARIHQRRGEAGLAMESFGRCAYELGVTAAEYCCRCCSATYPDWRDYCENCGSWNSVELNFQEEQISAEELGLAEAPVWEGYGESAEIETTD